MLKQNGNGNGGGSNWQKIGSYTNKNQREIPIVVNTQNCCVQQPVGPRNNIFAMIRELKAREVPHHIDPQALEELRLKHVVPVPEPAIAK